MMWLIDTESFVENLVTLDCHLWNCFRTNVVVVEREEEEREKEFVQEVLPSHQFLLLSNVNILIRFWTVRLQVKLQIHETCQLHATGERAQWQFSLGLYDIKLWAALHLLWVSVSLTTRRTTYSSCNLMSWKKVILYVKISSYFSIFTKQRLQICENEVIKISYYIFSVFF